MPPRKKTEVAPALFDPEAEEPKKALALVESAPPLREIADENDFAVVLEATQEYASLWKEIDGKRTELKRPILEAGRAIDDFFRAPLAKLKSLEESGRTAMLAFKRKRDEEIRAAAEAERKRAEAEQQAQTRVEQGNFVPGGFGAIKSISTLPSVPAPAPLAVEGFGTRKTYVAEVRDLSALVGYAWQTGMLQLLLPNQALLDGMAKNAGEERPLEIPGVVVVAKESAVLR